MVEKKLCISLIKYLFKEKIKIPDKKIRNKIRFPQNEKFRQIFKILPSVHRIPSYHFSTENFYRETRENLHYLIQYILRINYNIRGRGELILNITQNKIIMQSIRFRKIIRIENFILLQKRIYLFDYLDYITLLFRFQKLEDVHYLS